MLSSLHIENIAVIKQADVEFDIGFNVLTGETGAGKSIVIDSINAVLGNRTSKELIRNGCDFAKVSALFTDISDAAMQKLNSLGFNATEREISIVRMLSENKSTAKINGVSTTASVVRELAPYLINIHGQHDSQALLDADKHYIYIDLLAENEELLSDYKNAFNEMQATRKRFKSLSEDIESREKRRELLEFQINELENADIKQGEIVALKQRRNEISNSKAIVNALSKSLALLRNEDDLPSVVSLIDSTLGEVNAFSSLSNNVAEITNDLELLHSSAFDICNKIESVCDGFDFDEEEIETCDTRIDMYYRFSQKYGKTEEEMIDFLCNAKQELSKIDDNDDELIQLQSKLSPQVELVKQLGAKLSESRKNAANKFAEAVADELSYLNMPNVKIVVDIKSAPYSRLGADKIEFLISTNPGEPPKPLAKIASGGEMSRIMLSIKNVLAQKDTVDTLVFDEIDTGISGHAATKVGKKLLQIAGSRQTICVTHLAQIAALSQCHLLISKEIEDDKASTKIERLSIDKKRNEIARIIGSAVTPATLSAADELINSNVE